MIKHTRPEARVAARGTPIRTVIFPNVAGTRYTLRTWDSGRLDARGCTVIRYELRKGFGDTSSVLFEGEDFVGSPMHADDADETMAGLLGFLTLRPGDTDADYFAAYTPEQLAWAESHAEALALAVADRFCPR